jgi:hypothetical protein
MYHNVHSETRYKAAFNTRAKKEEQIQNIWGGGGGAIGRPLWTQVCYPNLLSLKDIH